MKKSDIKLRRLVFVLSTIAVLSCAIGGYLFYSTLRKSAIGRLHREVAEELRNMGNHVDSHLSFSLTTVKALAGLEELLNKFVQQVEKILKNFPKPLEWRSFYSNALAILMDFCEEVQEVSIQPQFSEKCSIGRLLSGERITI